MRRYRAGTLAVLFTAAFGGAALAQAMPTNDPEAKVNVRESEAYSALLRSNPGFRKKREAIECGPITDSQLRASCIASFEAYAAPPANRGR